MLELHSKTSIKQGKDMNTKIVYCLVSSEKDIYLEQAWVSIYSLRLHNPCTTVILVLDKLTAESLTGSRAKIKQLVTEVKVIETPEGYNAKERSRYLKTNFRQFLSGDLLFIDTDTIIGGPLDDVDNISDEIACVPDYHVKFKDIPVYKQLSERIQGIFEISTDDAEYYFNFGVIYVKDTYRTRAFFADWYDRWKYSSFQKNCSFDQPALFAADKKNGYFIKQMSGTYNCQILYSMQYLHSGRILHFFNTTAVMGIEQFSPFYENSIYLQIKKDGGILGDMKMLIEDPSRWIKSPSYFVNKEQYLFLTSPVGLGMFSHYLSNSRFYRLLKKYCDRK